METPDASLSPEKAFQLVSQFFDEEWPLLTNAQDLQISRLTGGSSSDVYVVRRSTPSVREPASVVLRFYSTKYNDSPLWRTDAEEVLFFTEMARRGWGPKLHGVFAGGRVEEFVVSHTLTPEECMQTDISKDLAQAFARVHSLTPGLPFRRNKLNLMLQDMIDYACSKSQEEKDALKDIILSLGDPESEHSAHLMQSDEWEQEMVWLQQELHNLKRSFILMDTNFLNVLVKEKVTKESESRIMMIDYEAAHHGYRGVDLGSHFMGRMFAWSHPHCKVTGHGYPSLGERRTFCQFYLQELLRLQSEDERDVDMEAATDELVRELDVGVLFFACWVMSMITKYRLPDKLFVVGLSRCIRLYYDRKNELMQSKPQSE